jgi:hypothetical protein
MAKYTNTAANPINLPDGTQMPPGLAIDVPDEAASNARFKELVADKTIVAGEPKPDAPTPTPPPQPLTPTPPPPPPAPASKA